MDAATGSSLPAPTRHTRSRHGCSRCKRRRQKCDQLKPHCTRCVGAGKPCTYGLQLRWGGKTFPKSFVGDTVNRVPTTSSGSTGDGFVYALSTQPAARSPRRQPERGVPRVTTDHTPLPIPAMEAPEVQGSDTDQDGMSLTIHISGRRFMDSTLSPMAQFLLHYYVTETVRLTAPSAYARSQICRYLLPMSLEQPSLLFAVMTLAAVHLEATKAISGNTGQLISNLRRTSIRHLREQLWDTTSSGNRAVALATSRTLCQADIFRGECSWRVHLEGAKAILESSPLAGQGCFDRDEEFLSSWYNNAEALAALTPLGLLKGQLEAAHLSNRSTLFDVFGGVASDLPDLLREVGALVSECRRKRVVGGPGSLLSEEDITLEAVLLVQEIEHRLQRDGPGDLSLNENLRLHLSEEDIHDYALSNAGFLYTALLHVHCAIRGLPPSSPEVQHVVEQVIWCAQHMRPSVGLSPRVLLVTPLFNAGLCALGPARDQIRAALTEIGKWMTTPHVIRGISLLEELWSRVEDSPQSDVWEYIEQKSPEFIPY